MIITLELISGVSFGVQFITKEELGDDDNGWYVLVEVGVLRFIFEK